MVQIQDPYPSQFLRKAERAFVRKSLKPASWRALLRWQNNEILLSSSTLYVITALTVQLLEDKVVLVRVKSTKRKLGNRNRRI